MLFWIYVVMCKQHATMDWSHKLLAFHSGLLLCANSVTECHHLGLMSPIRFNLTILCAIGQQQDKLSVLGIPGNAANTFINILSAMLSIGVDVQPYPCSYSSKEWLGLWVIHSTKDGIFAHFENKEC